MTTDKSINTLFNLGKDSELRSIAQFLVLAAIAELGKDPSAAEEKFGNGIQKFLKEKNINMSVSTITTILQRLHKMGLVSRQWSKARPARGGRRRCLYNIKETGRCALNKFETEEIRPAMAFIEATT